MDALEFVWIVPRNHLAFDGHFPGQPILPGVVLLDQVIQLAQQAVQHSVDAWEIGYAKFLSTVGPGEVLHFSVQPGSRGGMSFRVVTAAGVNVATGTVAAVAA